MNLEERYRAKLHAGDDANHEVRNQVEVDPDVKGGRWAPCLNPDGSRVTNRQKDELGRFIDPPSMDFDQFLIYDIPQYCPFEREEGTGQLRCVDTNYRQASAGFVDKSMRDEDWVQSLAKLRESKGLNDLKLEQQCDIFRFPYLKQRKCTHNGKLQFTTGLNHKLLISAVSLGIPRNDQGDRIFGC